MAVFNGKVPTDRDEREELLDSLDCDDVLSECDDEFYEYEDNLEELNYPKFLRHIVSEQQSFIVVKTLMSLMQYNV